MVVCDKIYNMTEHDTPEHLETTPEQLMEAGRDIFDTPDFHDAIRSALDDHAGLFMAQRQGRQLTPAEKQRFDELNDYIIATNRILGRYNQPKSDQ